MGNSVSDFKKGRLSTYRDRIKLDVGDVQFGDGWVSTKPTKPAIGYSSGSLSRCVDQVHPLYHTFVRNREKYAQFRSIDIGGPLAIEKSWVSLPAVVDVKVPLIGSVYRGYKGVHFPTQTYKGAMQNARLGSIPPVPLDLGIDHTALWGLGSTAVAKSLPDVPQFSLFRFIGELKQGLPKVPATILAKERKLRSVGGEYLNYQFGVAPTIKDVEKLVKVLSNPALRSAVRHTLDEEHRVRKTLEKGKSQTVRNLDFNEMNTVPGLASPTGTLTTTSEYKIWSSITFVYYQATLLDQLITDLDEKLGGLGALPSAIDVWNLVAWSWLVDWFVNFNHVITNLSYLGRDGLHLQRGYLMAHYLRREEYRVSGTIYGQPSTTVGSLLQERKYRVAASPFGFGYTWKDFNPFQLSILGSLGVSRLKF